MVVRDMGFNSASERDLYEFFHCGRRLSLISAHMTDVRQSILLSYASQFDQFGTVGITAGSVFQARGYAAGSLLKRVIKKLRHFGYFFPRSGALFSAHYCVANGAVWSEKRGING